ncbi:glutamate racemase [Yunchengibacter salinarum]|uniref:glutamate racemase n=1 Tax=Yunchengibacter salinarum TaxID=3133399 RepID=UPI0035B5F74E
MIGVFDSGSGGLTILQALRRTFPDRDFLYLGDHANAPMGHRSNEQIVAMTRSGVDRLMQAGCTLVILACNTAAAVALRTLQQTWLDHAWPGNRILGVLVPTVEQVTGLDWQEEAPRQRGGEQTIVLFATRKTVESGAYSEEVAKRAPGIRLVQKACPGLVDALEGGAGSRPVDGLVAGYVAEALDSLSGLGVLRPDAVLLGCTHFPLAGDSFRKALGPDVPIYSQPDIVAHALGRYLVRHPDMDPPGRGQVRQLTTGTPGDMAALARVLPAEYLRFSPVEAALGPR